MKHFFTRALRWYCDTASLIYLDDSERFNAIHKNQL